MPDEFDAIYERVAKSRKPDEFDDLAGQLAKPSSPATRTETGKPIPSAIFSQLEQAPKYLSWDERVKEAEKLSGAALGGETQFLGVRARDMNVPWHTGIQNTINAQKYQEANKAFEDKTATNQQLVDKFLYEQDQAYRNRPKGLGEQAAEVAAQTPGFLIENIVGLGAVNKGLKGLGAAARGLGILPKAAPVAEAVAAPVARGLGQRAASFATEAAKDAGKQILATPLVTSGYVEQAQQRAMKNGGEWTDVANLGPQLAYAGVQNAVLGQVAGATKGLNAPTRIGLAGAGMVAEQAAVDALSTKIDEQLRAKGFDKKWEMGTNYGSIGKLASGEAGEGWKEIAIQALTGAGFALMTGGKGKPKTDPVDALQKAADSLHEAGVPPETAAKTIDEALKNPDAATPGPVKDFVEAQKEAQAPPEPVKPTQEIISPEKSPETPPEAPKADSGGPAEPVSEMPVKPDIAPETKPQDAGPTPEPAKPPEGDPNRFPPDVIGLTKAFDDAERVRLGQPEALKADPVGHSFPELHQQIQEIAKTDPERHRRLADELIKSPRNISDLDAGLLLRRAVELNVDHKRANAELEAARQTNDPVRIADAEAAERTALDAYMAVRKAARETGAAQGRGLNAWKMFENEDFTLAEMMSQTKNAKGSRFTDEDEAKVREAYKKIEDLQKKVDELEANQRKSRVAKVDVAAPAKGLGTRTEKARKEVDAAWEGLRQVTKGKLFSVEAAAGEAVVASAKLAKAYIKLGVAKFAEFVAAVRQRSGKDLPPEAIDLLKKGWEVSHAEVASERSQRAAARMKDVDAKNKPSVGRLAKALYKDFAAAGLDGMDARIDAVHAELQKIDPTMTRDQAMDAISGYGEYKQLSKEQLEAEIRDQKGQMQQLAKLRDMEAKQAPKKTGMERREPSAEERDLIRKVNEKKKELGYDVTDPETQLKSSLDSAKTRMKNQIEDMTKQIEKGQKSAPLGRTPLKPDAELAALTAKRDALKAEYDAKFTNPEKEANDRLAKHYEKRIAELQKRIKDGDFAESPKREEVRLTPENEKAKAELAKAQAEWREGKLREQAENRPAYEKRLAMISKWYRGSILSSPITLAKLTSAAVERTVFAPIQNLVGAGVGKVLPNLAAKATFEGGFNLKQEARAFTKGWMNWMTDAKNVWKTGDMDIGHLYGDRHLEIDPSFADYFGRLHYLLKTPAKRASFERAMERNAEAAIKAGLDVTDPLVQQRLGVEAYKHAERSIFMQDNFIVDMWKRAINYHPTTKFVGNMTLPIVRIPTNIILESFNHAFGTVLAPARLAWGKLFLGGIEKMTPAQADSVLRQFKQGFTGLGMIALGYYLKDDIGGFYDYKDKRKEGDVDFMEMRIFGRKVPGYLTHNPLLEMLQFGATIGRASEHRVKGVPQGDGVGLARAVIGLAEETPFVREMTNIERVADGQSQNVIGGKMRSYLVPQGAQWIAGNLDKKIPFNPLEDPVKRKPEKDKGIIRGLGQEVQRGVPFLRNRLPERQ